MNHMKHIGLLKKPKATSCSVALGVGFLSAAISWFSPWKEWTAEVAISVGFLFGISTWIFNLLTCELDTLEIERQKAPKKSTEPELGRKRLLHTSGP